MFGINDPSPYESDKKLDRELKRQAKLEKLKQKLEKKNNAEPKKDSEKKEKKKENKVIAVYNVPTPEGEKKDVLTPLPDGYSPRYVEAAWYSWWEKQGFFKPEWGRPSVSIPNSKGKFTIIIPPPNVTGSLHLGHALTNAIQDSLVRWHRMKGETTLWNPGCDHAGIATQVVVEKRIWRNEKKTRHDLGRTEFIKRVWEWKEQKGHRIYEQLKKLGSSYDWDRAQFTMNPQLSRAVTEAFVRLHDEGLIYRANRLVNWSCTLKSAISDIEVDKVEVTPFTYLTVPGYDKKVEVGVLVLFTYHIEGTDESMVIATTRVETMLGDTAVAVHPDDKRYKHVHGKYVIHPFCNRRMPIITDEYVDPEFGSGCMKITPAHDANDYEMGKRHNLPFITVFDEEGNIINGFGKFSAMKRFTAREAIIEELQKIGDYLETVPNPMVVPICSRTRDIIEPMLKPQWYVKSDDMAAKALDAVTTGELKIIPEMHVKTWHTWMNGIKDWCISRQLWWGHRIPAYSVSFKDKSVPEAAKEDLNVLWVAGRTEEEALEKAVKKFNTSADNIILHQDEDVLDTWFSSGLFPFSIFGWPDDTEDLRVFYPSSLLETGHDILFFWVARMVFFGQKLLGKLPFKEVYLHPIVRDAHGRKMSKSLGNVIDPIDVINGITLEGLHRQLYDSNLDTKEIEKAQAGQKQDYPNGIPECGTDALRFALCAMCYGRDINLDILRVQGYRFFCNKVWNAVKFALSYFTGSFQAPVNTELIGNEKVMDLWMLSRLSFAIQQVNRGLENYDFAAATTAIYNVWLYELCDIYLECLKPVFNSGDAQAKDTAQATLYRALDIGLRLLSPFMPFITEELYQRLPRPQEIRDRIPSIAVAPYPELEDHPWRDETLENEFEFMQKVAKVIRSTRSDYNLPNKTKTDVYIQASDSETEAILKRFAEPLATLAYCSKITVNEDSPLGCAMITVSNKCQINIYLKGLIDSEKEQAKMRNKVTYLQEARLKLWKLMRGEHYSKVPEEVQEANTVKLNEALAELDRVEMSLAALRLMDKQL